MRTYAEIAAFHAPIEHELQTIANRIHQGAIGDELAAHKLRDIADRLDSDRRRRGAQIRRDALQAARDTLASAMRLELGLTNQELAELEDEIHRLADRQRDIELSA